MNEQQRDILLVVLKRAADQGVEPKLNPREVAHLIQLLRDSGASEAHAPGRVQKLQNAINDRLEKDVIRLDELVSALKEAGL